MEKLNSVAVALKERGFEAVVCKSRNEAVAVLLKEAEDSDSVGFGGSATIGELGIRELLAEKGKSILRHGDPNLTPEKKMEIMRSQQTADLFLMSANAITEDGRIVNIDGVGNRVAASIFGPKKVIFVIGRNKIVSGGIDAAIEKIKRDSSPRNCVRLNKKTPCAVTGECADCNSPDRICKVTVIFDRCPSLTKAVVILIDEDLGF